MNRTIVIPVWTVAVSLGITLVRQSKSLIKLVEHNYGFPVFGGAPMEESARAIRVPRAAPVTASRKLCI